MKNSVTKSVRFFMLQEMLLTMAIGMVVTTQAIRVMHTVWTQSRNQTQALQQLQGMAVVEEKWRRFIHAVPVPLTLVDKQTIKKGQWSAKLTDHHLVLSGPGQVKQLKMPAGIKGTFDVEKDNGMSFWVLTWALPSRDPGPKTVYNIRTLAKRNTK